MPDPTTLPASSILVRENVRDVDQDHVERLAGSISLQGMLVPLLVKPDGGGGFELVAGFHRLAAAKYLDDKMDVPVIVRDSNGSTDTERAVENIVRKDLTPAEEAIALDRALQSGLSEQGAAQALGWSAKRVTERKRILELPEDTRTWVGDAFRTECVDLLIELEAKAPKLWARLADSISGDPGEGDSESLAQLRDWVHTTAWRDSKKVEAWCAHGAIHERDLPKMKAKLQDRWRGLVNKEYGYEREFGFSFTQQDLDAATAAGCYIELGSAGGVVVDKSMVLLAAEAAVTRAEQALEDARDAKKKQAVAFEATPKDPQKVLLSLERRDIKDTTPATRQANEDLALAMIAGLSSVELTKDVAVFFSRTALRHLWDGGHVYQAHEYTAMLARRLALAIPELRTTIDQGETKAGKPKPVKVEYADDGQAAEWLRKWVEQPREPAEILGRTLTVFAIAREVDTDVVPKSVEVKLRWFSTTLPTDADKALSRIVKPHLPGSLKGIRREKAKLKKVREDAYQEALDARRKEHQAKGSGTDAEDYDPDEPLADDGMEGAEA